MSTPVVKVDKMTREVVARYPSCNECSRAEGIPAQTIVTACENRSLPSGRYYYRKEADFDPLERFEGKSNRPLISRDVESGTVAWHPSLREASEALFVCKNAISHAAKHGRLVGGRYRVAYCTIGLPKEVACQIGS